MTAAALLIRLQVLTSSSLVCLWSSRARVCRGTKLNFQHSAHLPVHSLEGEAGTSAFSPDPGKGSKELMKFSSIGVEHGDGGGHGSHFESIF